MLTPETGRTGTEKVCSRQNMGTEKLCPSKMSNNGHKWVPGLKISGKPVFASAISPRSARPTSAGGASRFWKNESQDDARPREGRACTPSHFPRFELKVKSCGIENAKKRSNFRTRSRSPPRASARGSRAPLPKRQRPRLHSATLATRNG